MATEEKKKTVDLNHQLTLSNRNLLGVEGVTNLGSYDHEAIIIETSSGVLEIKGNHLHIQQLNLDQGKLLIDGEIGSMVYTDANLGKGKGFLGRLIR